MDRPVAMALVMASLTACSTHSSPVTAISSVAPSCNGEFVILRLDKIKKSGTIAGVEKAVEDHFAWYRSKGFNDNDVVAARVLKYDPTGNRYVNDESLVVTLHVNPPAEMVTATPHPDHAEEPDAAWDAYVKEYDDNSDIIATVPLCLPAKH